LLPVRDKYRWFLCWPEGEEWEQYKKKASRVDFLKKLSHLTYKINEYKHLFYSKVPKYGEEDKKMMASYLVNSKDNDKTSP
jgi:hypothetical protein